MTRLKLILCILGVTLCFPVVMAQVSLGSGSSKANEFTVVSSKANARLFFDEHDFEVVKKVADLFSNDVRMITGKAIQVGTTKDKLASNSIIVGTLGHNELINKLVAKNKLDVSSLKNRWESYLIEIVCNPLPGVGKALVVVGSDRRGTAYGLFSISEAMGISPWYWWADAPVVKRQELSLKVDRIIAKEPTVKYRGIFINDEDWGLLRWAKRTFEKERGNIGPKTYAKVCELLLRLKANYLCPAMHEASTAFNKISENKLVADSFAIVMGSVHCEPLLFNNASEWDKKTMGEWDYVNNKATLNKVLRQRVTENSPFENVYTLALRGLHDKAMGGSNNMKERVKMLGAALRDQRQLLVDVIKRPADEIPQAFTPYKEVLDVYSAGLDLPEDVTIIWPDDNYGYMKRLSSPREQKRSGRAGVYYHVSYLGKPHDYLWMSTTPPALMYEELRKAYDTTADRIWLLNVGDIKSCEFSMNLFLAMAYDIDSFNYDNISLYQARWLSNMFGDKYYDDFVEKLILHDPGYSMPVPMSRFDIFYNGYEDFGFCEINTDGTSAMLEDYAIASLLLESKIFEDLNWNFSRYELFDTWVKKIISLYKDIKGIMPKNVLIADFNDTGTPDEFLMFKDHFEKNGRKSHHREHTTRCSRNRERQARNAFTRRCSYFKRNHNRDGYRP